MDERGGNELHFMRIRRDAPNGRTSVSDDRVWFSSEAPHGAWTRVATVVVRPNKSPALASHTKRGTTYRAPVAETAVRTLILWLSCPAPSEQTPEINGAKGNDDSFDDECVRVSEPLLKSALQKSVRRCMADKAVMMVRSCYPPSRVTTNTTTTLERQVSDGNAAKWDARMSKLLRRIPIIMIEDGVASPDLPWIVWLMIAHGKGYRIDAADRDRIQTIVASMAALDVRDCIVPSEHLADALENAFPAQIRPLGSIGAGQTITGARSRMPRVRVRLGDARNHPLVDALLVRVLYGGMPGDMHMLMHAAVMWHARLSLCGNEGQEGTESSAPNAWCDAWRDLFCNSALHQRTEGVLNDCGGRVPTLADVPLEAADFHCFRWMPDTIVRALRGGDPSMTAEHVRETIWHHRSGISFKRPWVDPVRPLSLLAPSGVDENRPKDHPMIDDRVCRDAVVKTAQCWSSIRSIIDAISARAIADDCASTSLELLDATLKTPPPLSSSKRPTKHVVGAAGAGTLHRFLVPVSANKQPAASLSKSVIAEGAKEVIVIDDGDDDPIDQRTKGEEEQRGVKRTHSWITETGAQTLSGRRQTPPSVNRKRGRARAPMDAFVERRQGKGS